MQIDNFVTILAKEIIAEGGSEALVKYNQEQKKKKNIGRMQKGERSGKKNNNDSNKRKWNNEKTRGEKEGEN